MSDEPTVPTPDEQPAPVPAPAPVEQTPATPAEVTAPVLNVTWVGAAGLLGGYVQQANELFFQDKMAFTVEVKAIVKAALRTKIWRGSQLEGVTKLQALADGLSDYLHIPHAIVEIHPLAMGMGPSYADNTCRLDKVSLVSMLHEYGHHIQTHMHLTMDEVFPRAFSLGLFKAVAPKMFEKARTNGRLLFTDVTSVRQEPAPTAVSFGGGMNLANINDIIRRVTGTDATPTPEEDDTDDGDRS